MVDKTMTIRQVLEMDAGTARIMMSFGMHCLGCPSFSPAPLRSSQ